MGIPTGNVLRYYIWRFTYGFHFIYTLQALFLLSKGITPSQLALFASVTTISITLLEIPTGFIADKFSRRLSVSLGFFFGGLAILGFIFVHDLYSLLVVSLLMGLSEALKSGAAESLVYDDLKSVDKEGDYLSITSKGGSAATVSGAIATFLGPILYVVNTSVPFVLTAMANFIVVFLTFGFKEHRPAHQVDREIKILDGISTILKHRSVRLIVFMNALLLVFVNIFYQVIYSPKIVSLGLPVQYLGVLDVVNLLLMSYMLFLLPRLLIKNEKINLALYTLLPTVVFIAFGLNKHLVPAVLLGLAFDLAWSARIHIIPAITNRYFPSHTRALSLSSMSFVSNLAAAALVPLSFFLFRINYIFALIPGLVIVLLVLLYQAKGGNGHSNETGS